jgi:hypothetical protein
LKRPTGVAVTPSGAVFVVDAAQPRVLYFLPASPKDNK